MKTRRLLIASGAAALMAACFVISPLDELNDTTGGSDGGAGTAGSAGADGSAGSAGQAGSAGAGPCTSHVQCSDDEFGGEPARCINGVCKKLESEECRCLPNVPYEVWKNDDSILIGAFAELADPGQKCGDDAESRNYRFALEEINGANVGGLPGIGGKRRPIAVLICDNAATDGAATRFPIVEAGIKHLVDELGVSAVLPMIDTGDLVQLYPTYAATKGVFFLAPNGATEALAQEDDEDGNFLWHMLGLPGDVAPAFAALLAKMEPIVPGKLTEPAPLRVTMLTGTGGFEKDLEIALEQVLFFNGMNVSGNTNADNFRKEIVAGNTPAEIDAASLAAANAIIQYEPHIVISTIGEGMSLTYKRIEQGWHPYYILSPYNVGSLNPIMQEILNTWMSFPADTSLHTLTEKVVGINVAGTEDPELLYKYKNDFKDKYNLNLGEQNVENAYDSVYYLAYAILAGAPLDAVSGFGGQLPGGMLKIISQGPEFDVGPTDINAIMQELVKPTASIRVNGTLGPPVYFSAKNGVRESTGSLYCLQRVSNVSILAHDHVGHYDKFAPLDKLRVSKLWQGKTLPCLDWLGLPEP